MYAPPSKVDSPSNLITTLRGPSIALIGSVMPRHGDDAREWSSVEGWRVPGQVRDSTVTARDRPDDVIREDVTDRLRAHGEIDARHVACRVVDGEVTLTGHVGSRAAKRAAAAVAAGVYGVRDVENQLEVR